MKLKMAEGPGEVFADRHIIVLKKKLLAIGYLNTVVAFISTCILIPIAVWELQDGQLDTCVAKAESMWPAWQRSERGVVLAAVAVIDVGQTLVSAMLVVAVHKELVACATPWPLHSALWLPAQALAGLTAAAPPHRPLLALGVLVLLAGALLFWLSLCGAVKRFQGLLFVRKSGVVSTCR